MNVLESAAKHGNVDAFLHAIRLGEGTSGPDGYRTLFGGELFEDLNRHPNKLVLRGRYRSTAAGAYQIIIPTWRQLVREWQFLDFQPHTQDLAAIALIRGRHALDAVIKGDAEGAAELCAQEWASLPGALYGQPRVTMQAFLDEYARWLA